VGVALCLDAIHRVLLLALLVVAAGEFAWHRVRPSRTRHRLTVSSGQLLLDGKPLTPTSLLRRGVIVPRKDGSALVSLDRTRRLWPVWLFAPSVASAELLLDTAGLAPSTRVASFNISPWRSSSGWRRSAGWIFWVLVAVTTVSFSWLKEHTFWSLGPWLPLFVGILFPTTLRLAPDGLGLRWLWWSIHFPFSEVASVAVGRRGLVLTLADGEEISFDPSSGGWGGVIDADVLCAHLERARTAYLERASDCDLDLDRPPSLDLAAWVRRLRAMGSGAAATLRTAVPSEDRLWRVAENPAAPPTSRAAAAIALSGRQHEEGGRARLLRIAETTSSAALGDLLRAAAKGESEGDYVEHLGRLERHEGVRP
jgi:hypothetical protein